MLGVYVHIPFCVKKCLYCDFHSVSGGEELYSVYKTALVQEIRQNHAIKSDEISTIFFGGGTPTAIPPSFLCEILDELTKNKMSGNPEITVEANPGTLNLKTLRQLKAAGFNRLSIGLQAWQNRLLNTLGRIHTREEFLRNYSDAVDMGFDNINIDLMFSLPGQSHEDWEETLTEVIKLSPKHVSAYGLMIEEATEFGQMLSRGELNQPDDQTDRSMYETAKKTLCDNGYEHYEISNFAKFGYSSRHNTVYWEREAYIGFGAGAFSFVDNQRYNNIYDLLQYVEAAGDPHKLIENIQPLTQKDAMEETMFLGLRMLRGVSIDEFYKGFGINIFDIYGETIDKFINTGLMEKRAGRLALTPKGIDLSNRVFSEFLL